ncbi:MULTISPECIES: tRNA adenosine(34) deaminase TadA [Legionella]|uniref:tRNA-specific adenosine deaminase n=1 Tax=Legionella septentrionalis TaxID=2498109 RepID=A0A433JKY8_9GAMM|nr:MULTISPECIES: tRNA adenosine(34) deaminase TadA [Legionella]MCP0913456.1 tRNA adenosine(34) deaminase TadA [Legionella sp. 27cVA30]RUQ89766.1 tRNA adenosine(34) deaminase TadA [Legionella septentrionalis]RUQ99555.1 tRNA adenosine(34) deaminase TadA [Legionella septentrionalis]RUR11117.1 tRNA adenosine(34) deaminase TadA [Legionella septentrionalis]RUR14418.1 tRNA adenosine(34) deaminase TadA [Legionella septentrionalis]
MVKDDIFWMRQALQLAQKAKEQGEIPVGAVLVSRDGELLGEGWNQVLQTQDPCAHAELMAIRTAASCLQNYRLLDCTLYVTLEPCCMCAGAMVHARIKRLAFATRDLKAGAAGSVFNLLHGYPLNHRVQIDEGFLQKECADLLSNFFEARR